MKNAFVVLHLSILIAGFTGIFGRVIDLPAAVLVFWRVALACALLWAIIFWKSSRKAGPHPLDAAAGRDVAGMCATGALLMLSWIFFYAAIKASNVSVGVVAFSSVGFFTALIEPFFARRAVCLREVAFSLLTIAGIALVFQFDARHRLGIVYGLASGLTAALLAVFFKRFRAKFSAFTVLAWELAGAFAAALPAAILYALLAPQARLVPTAADGLWLILFASVFTIGMYLLQLQALEKISAFTVNLSYNLEPVYSIFLAMILFDEARALNWSFWAGLALIALSVGLQTASVLRK